MESGASSKTSLFKDQCDRDLFARLEKVVSDRVMDTNRPLIGILS
jgi:gamma-glutamyl-gamma-aminobutyrate hydrolase PuuD